MGQGKLGRGTQQQHKKAAPHSSPCQNEQTTRVGWNFCTTYMTHVVRTSTQLAYSYYNAKSHFFFLFFNLMLVPYLPGLGISEIRDLFFRGPIWIRLRNSGSFNLGQVPGTSHVSTRPKKHTCERRTCPSCRGLLQPALQPAPASNLFVVVQSVLDVIRIPGATVVASLVFFPYLLFFFVGWFLKEKYQVLEE